MNKKPFAVITAALICLGLSACGSTTPMPDVEGMSVADARTKLSEERFYSIDVKDLSGNIALDGTVQEQKPEAGADVSSSDKVELKVKSALDESKENAKKMDDLKKTAEKLNGESAKKAIEMLKVMDALGTIKDRNGAEITEQRINDDEAAGVKWVVTEATAHTIMGQNIDLSVDTESNAAADQAKEQQKKQLEDKLSTSSALAACRAYGKQQYPYGFKTHDIAGVLQDFTPTDDNTWFYKATVDVTNAFGATQKDMNYECTVTGTTDNPQVVGFNVY